MMGMGHAPLKDRGAPTHPDDVGRDLTDKEYLRRLQAYSDHWGYAELLSVPCARDRLLALVDPR
jgi:hypothetical protein